VRVEIRDLPEADDHINAIALAILKQKE